MENIEHGERPMPNPRPRQRWLPEKWRPQVEIPGSPAFLVERAKRRKGKRRLTGGRPPLSDVGRAKKQASDRKYRANKRARRAATGG